MPHLPDHVPPPAAPAAREPIFNLPGIVVAALLLLAGLHALREVVLDAETGLEWVLAWGVVPARVTTGLGFAEADAVLAEALREGGPHRLALARYVLGEGGTGLATLLSHALLHGSWTHLGLNALWLAAFGAPVARRLGSGRFLLLAAIGAAGGAVAHIASDPLGVGPMIGASTAISALTGAAALFAFAPPGAGPGVGMVPAHARPRQGLRALAGNRTAAGFVAAWFVTTILAGLAPASLGGDGTIAWQAHLGGFLAGLLAFPLLDPLRPAA